MREPDRTTGDLAKLLEEMPIYQGHPALDEADLDFDLGVACDITDTDCESCQ